LVSLTGQRGAQLRATVSSFGPLLLAKVLGLNETQTSVLGLVFKYAMTATCSCSIFPDCGAVLQHLTATVRLISKTTAACRRRASECCYARWSSSKARGTRVLRGNRNSSWKTCCKSSAMVAGLVTILALADVQDKPALFSTFMMWMLARLYATAPGGRDIGTAGS